MCAKLRKTQPRNSLVKKSMARKSHWHRRHFTASVLPVSMLVRSDILHIEKSFPWFCDGPLPAAPLDCGRLMKPKRTILCVDDNEQSLSHRKIMLETRGYRVANLFPRRRSAGSASCRAESIW